MISILPVLLRGHIITDASYTWDTTYSKILIQDDLEAQAQVTTETACTTGDEAYYDNTIDFYFPKKFGHSTILDGVADGNIRIKQYAERDYRTTWCRHYFKGTISIITKTVTGTVRTLGSVAITERYLQDTDVGTPTTSTYDIPFFIPLDNAIIPNTEKILLRLLLQSKATTDTGLYPIAELYYVAAINTNNIMLRLPVVPLGE